MGSEFLSRVWGFISGLGSGIADYLTSKYSKAQSLLDLGKITLSMIDDGFGHVKGPIRQWANGVDKEVALSNNPLKADIWSKLKTVGNIASFFTSSNGILTGLLLSAAYKAGKKILNTPAPYSNIQGYVGKTPINISAQMPSFYF